MSGPLVSPSIMVLTQTKKGPGLTYSIKSHRKMGRGFFHLWYQCPQRQEWALYSAAAQTEIKIRIIYSTAFLYITLYLKLETYIPRNETTRPHFQVLHSCIWERYIYSHYQSYLESLFSCIAWENTWLNYSSREKGLELPPSSGWRQFPALPSAPAVEPIAHINASIQV